MHLWLLPLALILVAPLVRAEKPSVAEIIDAHGQTVCAGPCESWKGLAATGMSQLKALAGTRGLASGELQLETGNDHFDLNFRVARADFPGEHFHYDGENVRVAFVSPGVRSPFGDFVFLRSAIIKEGLLGGTLNPDWPLIDHERKRKIRYRGWKKRQKLHEISYRLSRAASLGIRIYLDEDWNHVKTTYTVTLNTGIDTPLDIRSEPKPWMEDQQATYVEVTETFGEFRSVGSLTLPTSWEMEYTRQGTQQGRVWKWSTRFTEMQLKSADR